MRQSDTTDQWNIFHRRRLRLKISAFILWPVLFLLLLPAANLRAGVPVKVGVFQNKPIVYHDGQAKGLFVEILDSVAEKNGWELEYVLCELKTCLEKLKTNQLDLMTSVGTNAERLTYLSFSQESIWTFWGTIYSHDRKITGIFDLQGKSIGVRRKNKTTAALQRLLSSFDISVDYTEFNNYESAFHAFEQKKLDAVAVNNTYGFGKQKEMYIYRTPIVFNPFSAYFAAPKDGQHVAKLASIDEHVRHLKASENSVFDTFKQEWFGIAQPYLTIYQILLPVSILLVITILAAAIWRYRSLSHFNKKLARTVDEREQAERKTAESNARLMTILDTTPADIYIADMESYEILYMNKQMVESFGKDLTGEICWKAFRHDSKPCEHCTNQSLLDENGQPAGLITWEDKNNVNGKTYLNQDRAIHWTNDKIARIQFAVDITERKQIEEELRENEKQLKHSLKEKETLLQEIHHRVKNNMQVVSSLINLQSNTTEDARLKELLKESQNRVYAMSAVHEILHESRDLSVINLKTYLVKISNTIFQTYNVEPGLISLKNEIDAVSINMDKASALGLTVNELISNSLKYAFPDGKSGAIMVRAEKKSGKLAVTVKDNGIGLPETLDWNHTDTLGLKLVRTLVEKQLGGSIRLRKGKGVEFLITFTLDGD